MATVVRSKFKARAIINPTREDGTSSVSNDYIQINTELELSSVVMSYGLNAIPMASIQLAAGRKNVSIFDVSVGHALARQILRRVEVIIEVQIEGTEDGTRPWQPGFFTIFDGFTNGINIIRAFEDNSYKLGIIHWLAALTESSILSERLHPTAPGPLFIGLDPLTAEAQAGAITHLTEVEKIARREDLWAGAILPTLISLANEDRAAVTELDRLEDDDFVVSDITPANEAALAALNRFVAFDPEAGGIEGFAAPDSVVLDIAISVNDAKELPAKPLRLSPELSPIGLDNFVVSTLHQILIRDGRVNDSFWDRIMFAAMNFEFAIVPAVNSAAAAPVLTSGSRTPHLTVKASEIFTIQGTSSTDRVPRGLALWTPDAQSTAGLFVGYSAGVPVHVKHAGRFNLRLELKKEAERRRDQITDDQRLALEEYSKVSGQGLWIFREAPQWLTDSGALDTFLTDSIRPDITESVKKNFAAGITTGEAPSEKEPVVTTEKDKIERVTVGNRFAHAMLLDEIFRNRTAVLSGRFRVDICPGSTIQLETLGANIQDLPIAQGYSGRLQAMVTNVTLQLDAQSSTAVTSLTLSHVRNEPEVFSETFSPPAHPLYNQEFKGGFLAAQNEAGVFRSLFEERREAGLAARAGQLESLTTSVRETLAQVVDFFGGLGG